MSRSVSRRSASPRPGFTALALVALWLIGCGEPPPPPNAPPPTETTAQPLAGPYDPWLGRHGMTGAEFEAESNARRAQGFRLTSLSGYEEAGSARYVAIWEKTSGPDWAAVYGLTGADYQTNFNLLGFFGYHPVQVSAFTVGGVGYFAAIFHYTPGLVMAARHGMTPDEYQVQFNYWASQGYRLTDVSGYMSDGFELLAAIWVKEAGPPLRAYHGLSPAEFQAVLDANRRDGYRPVKVSGYNVRGDDRYAAIFHAEAGPPWEARFGLTSAQYQQAFNDLHYQGYRPLIVRAHSRVGEPSFSLVWQNVVFSATDLAFIDNTVRQAMNASGTVGLSLAIVRNGRLVFAKGYGLADQSTGTPVNTSHRFRIASVSKTLTAMGIMRLVDRGQLHLWDRVFGPGSLLGDTYRPDTGYLDPRVLDITVQNLLEHTAGGWDTDPWDGTEDPMDLDHSWDHTTLIKEVLKTRPLEFPPGTKYQYSNFGYCLLGRIIKAVSGKDYDVFMRDELFTPSGATGFAVAGDTLAARLPDEVVYYQLQQGGYDPYGVAAHRMDANGGWVVSPIDLVRVAVRGDGFGTVPDLLSANAVSTMTTVTTARSPTGEPVDYAKGWHVTSSGNWWHGGNLPGTAAFLVRTEDAYGPSGSDEFVWSVVTNSSKGNDSPFNLDDLMWTIVRGVHAWPDYDLF